MLLGPTACHGPLQKDTPLGCGWYVIRLLKGQVLPLNVPLTL